MVMLWLLYRTLWWPYVLCFLFLSFIIHVDFLSGIFYIRWSPDLCQLLSTMATQVRIINHWNKILNAFSGNKIQQWVNGIIFQKSRWVLNCMRVEYSARENPKTIIFHKITISNPDLSTFNRGWYSLFCLLLHVGIYALVVMTENFRLVLSLGGAISGSCIIQIFPAMYYLKIFNWRYNGLYNKCVWLILFLERAKKCNRTKTYAI